MVSSMKDWTHEKGSLDLLDHLIKANHLDLSAYGIHAQDYTFIRELILGHPLPESTSFQGRPNSPFLYEIVNNAKTGLDVDKLDYFMRDAMYTGAKAVTKAKRG
jgi:HD superfamily phosphohydrolase